MTGAATMATRAVPKQFSQLKLATQGFVLCVGLFVGTRQRINNQKLWFDHERKQWAKNAVKNAEEAKKKRELEVLRYGNKNDQNTGIAAMVPEGPLRSTIKDVQKAFEETH